MGDIVVTGGGITISYTGGSTTTSDGTTSGDIDPDVAPADELGIAAAEGVPEGNSVLLGSSCSLNIQKNITHNFQTLLWLAWLVVSCYIPCRVYRFNHRSILKLSSSRKGAF